MLETMSQEMQCRASLYDDGLIEAGFGEAKRQLSPRSPRLVGSFTRTSQKLGRYFEKVRISLILL
jgi:hypothetical protein